MSELKGLLPLERSITGLTTALLLGCALSGFVPFFIEQHRIWLQWTVLLHLLLGIALSGVLLGYLLIHFRRTISFRRIGVLLTGWSLIFCVLGFIGSGWYLLLFGLNESDPWLYPLHWISASLFLGLVLVHLVLHLTSLPAKRYAHDSTRFPALSASRWRTLAPLAALPLVVLLLTLYYRHSLPAYSDQAVVADYQYNYGPHPFRPSQTETTSNRFVDRRQIGNSLRCSSCHEGITRQWIASAHQQAASDVTYVTNVNLLEKKKGISTTRYCEGCHAPVALLTGELSPGGLHGGKPDTPANQEGVSCMGCHGIRSLTHLKGVASFVFGPAEDYLFARSEQPLLQRLNALLIRVKPAQHKHDMMAPVLRDAKMCAACHAQFMDKDVNNWGWVKMQDEYAAWLESPYSKHQDERFANREVTRCQDCHMVPEPIPDPSADANGLTRSHHFPAANTFLPLLRGDTQHLEAIKRFLQSNKLRLSIDTPNRSDAVQTEYPLDPSVRGTDEAPYYYYLGETAEISLVVSNVGVGHDFPGGTTDINQAWIEFLVTDAEGRPLYQSGQLDDQLQVDPGAYFYRAQAVDRHGALVWRHDLFNMIGNSFKRVIKAGESDIVRYRFAVPAWAKSPLVVSSSLQYRKLNQRYARWAMGEHYQPIPVVTLAWDALEIPLRVRREVESLGAR